MAIYIVLLTGIALSGLYLFEFNKNCAGKVPGGCFTACNSIIIFYLAAACLTFTLISALRFGIGYDYYSYRDIYESVKVQSVSHIMKTHWKECLFYLFCKFCSVLSLSYPIFLGTASLWIHSVAMWFIHRFSKIPWFSVYLYITLQFFAHNMNLLRQSIAVSFFMLAYPYLFKRQPGHYLLFMIIGGLFHNSLFLIIPLYFLLPLRNTVKRMLLCTLLLALAYLFSTPTFSFLSNILLKRFSSYQTSEIYWSGSSFVYTIFPTIYFLLILLFEKCLQPNRKNREEQSDICSDIAVNSSFFTAAISFFITRHFILERFSIYTFVFSLIIIPEIINRYQTNSKQRYLVLMSFLLFATLYFIFAAVKGFHHVYPYISLFERAVSVNHSY